MKLLVCTDLSPRSDIAIRRAIQLAGESGEIYLLHIVDDTLSPEIQQSAIAAATSRIDLTLSGLEVPPGVKLVPEVTSGSAYRTIAKLAELQNVDLIVFGAHRPFASAYRAIGSTIEKVLKSTHIPVLIARERHIGPYSQVIVGIDFSANSRKAIEIAPLVAPEAEIHLVHSFLTYRHATDAQARARQLEAEHRRILQRMLLTDQELASPPPILIDQDEPIGLLRDQVAEKHAELLVIGSSSRSGLTRIVLGSVAEDLLIEPPCDLLVVHAL